MTSRTPNFKPALLPLMISCALSSQAVTADEKNANTQELDVILVEGTTYSRDESQIDAKELERLNPSDLQDVFRNTPSVQVGSSIAASQKVFVNGVEETNLSVTIDGARQNNKLFHHSATNIIDPELLKAVNVDAGVAPADAGPGALGGALAYETKDVADLLEEGDNFGGSIGLEYNTNGDTFDRNITLYGRAGGFEALGFVKSASGEDFEDGNGDEVLGSEAALKSGLFKVGYLHESGYRTQLSYEKVKDDGQRPERANFDRGFTSERNELDRETIVLSIKNESPTGLFNPYARIAHTDSNLVWVNSSYPSEGEYESLNAVIANEFVLDNGSVDAGVDYYSDTTKGIFPTFNSFPEEKSNNIGAFAQARLTLNQQARLSFGARYDDHEITGVDGSEHNNSGLSSNISGEYDVTEFVTASAGYAHVFGGVQLAEPYIINDAWDYSAGLKESTANNSYVGLSVNGEAFNSALSGLTLGVKLISTDIEDIRDEEYNGGPDIYSDVESDGFEISSRYDWQSGFARLTYVDIDTEINGIEGSTSAHYVATSVGRFVKADFAHLIDGTGVMVGADVAHYFEMDGVDGTTRVEDAFASYTVANSFISYTPEAMNNLTLRASINNMFDQNYADRATYGHEYGEGTTLNEPGRSIVLSAKVKF